MVTMVHVYTCVVRTNAQHPRDPESGQLIEVVPASIEVTEKEFHAAHWASATGRAIPQGRQPSDATPIERGDALELLNRWNRFSDHSQDGREVKYWIK